MYSTGPLSEIRYDIYLLQLGFKPGGSGPYTCTQKAKNSNVHKEKQYRSQNTQNRKHNIKNSTT